MPAPGDVDIMIAAEMMEAGRSIIRGFVTPDRTTLIASTHRALAVSEKMVPGDGIASSDEVMAAAEIAARHFVAADFDTLAQINGSVISAALFGALAGSGSLPFPREAFEAAIRASGKGVEGSLRAFGAAFDAAANPTEPEKAEGPRPDQGVHGPTRLMKEWDRLAAKVAALPKPVAELAWPGLRKVVDFQDLRYGAIYLDCLAQVLVVDSPAHGWILSREAAKYIANAMAYDDIIRVADLKTRGSRFDRIRKEMRVKDANILQLTEFFHPRAEEIVGLFPSKMGAKLENNPRWMARLDRWFNKGRRMRTDSLRAFLALHIIGGLRGWRLRTLRHAQEQAHLKRWLDRALGHADANYDLAVEVIRCRRLIKGYSDTHARGHAKFDRVLEATAAVATRKDAADWCRRLREAALKDEDGKALDGAIQTIRSFA
jgi:indolepyruvate ferredoxin oxidoreductase beta subunit